MVRLACRPRVSLRSPGLRKKKKRKRNAGRRSVAWSARKRRAARATELRRLAPPSACGRARLPAFHHGTCGSDRTPPLSSSHALPGTGLAEGRALPAPGRPSAAGFTPRSGRNAGRAFYPEPPGSGDGEPPPAGTVPVASAGATGWRPFTTNGIAALFQIAAALSKAFRFVQTNHAVARLGSLLAGAAARFTRRIRKKSEVVPENRGFLHRANLVRPRGEPLHYASDSEANILPCANGGGGPREARWRGRRLRRFSDDENEASSQMPPPPSRCAGRSPSPAVAGRMIFRS